MGTPIAVGASVVALRRGVDPPFPVLALIVGALEALAWLFLVAGMLGP